MPHLQLGWRWVWGRGWWLMEVMDVMEVMGVMEVMEVVLCSDTHLFSRHESCCHWICPSAAASINKSEAII